MGGGRRRRAAEARGAQRIARNAQREGRCDSEARRSGAVGGATQRARREPQRSRRCTAGAQRVTSRGSGWERGCCGGAMRRKRAARHELGGGGGVRGAAHGARFVMNGERGGERGRCAVQVCCAFKWGLRAKRPVPGSAALLRTATSTFLRCCALQLRVQYLAVGSGGLDAK